LLNEYLILAHIKPSALNFSPIQNIRKYLVLLKLFTSRGPMMVCQNANSILGHFVFCSSDQRILFCIGRRGFLQGTFTLKLNNILPKVFLNEDFIISINKKGKFKTATDVIFKRNDDGNLIVIKKYPDPNVLEKELLFASTYGGEKGIIRVPRYKRISDTEVEIEYVKAPNLLVKILSGDIDKKQIFSSFNLLSKGIDELYKGSEGKNCLIHADLNPSNVFLINNKFYVVDCIDSHVYEKDFDKFKFLKECLRYFYGKDRYDIVAKFFNKGDLDKYRAYYNMSINKKYHGK